MWIFFLSNLGMGAGVTSAGTPLYLPYEFTSILIETDNVDPWGIDPEQTTMMTL